MRKLAIYGAGGLGRETRCLIGRINKAAGDAPIWDFAGFYDDGLPRGGHVDYGPVLGGIDDVNACEEPLDLVLAFGDPATIRAVKSRIVNPLISYPNIISPDVRYADPRSVTIGEGNIIQGGCNISCAVTIGDHNLLNGGVGLGHDVRMGHCNVLMPGTKVSGSVTIGDGNLLGVNVIVLQGLRIGNGVTVTPGSVLLTRPKDGNTYIGNPAKIFRF